MYSQSNPPPPPPGRPPPPSRAVVAEAAAAAARLRSGDLELAKKERRSFATPSPQPASPSLPSVDNLDELCSDDPVTISSPDAAIVVMDARPKVNAVANVAVGGGFEGVENYAGSNMQLHFLGE